jgi:hypothetical protein
MNLDLGEGEPRRAEHVFRRSGTGGRRTWSAARPWWSRWAARPWRPIGAVAAVAAVLAIVTGSPGWTLYAALTCFTGIALLALDTRRSGRVQPRLSLLTLRSWWARWSWRAILAVESRLPNPVYARRARRPWWSRDPRQPARTRWSRGPDAAPRRARGTDDAVDDRPGEGERR